MAPELLLDAETEDVLRERVVAAGLAWWPFTRTEAYQRWVGTHAVTAAIWDSTKHPRHPAGSEAGGEFAPKGVGSPASRGELTVEEEQAAWEALQAQRVAVDPPWPVEAPPPVSANVEVDYGPARQEFEDWAAGMEQWYTEKQGFAPDYWPTERDELWSRYEQAVAVELDPLRERLAQTGIMGVTIQPQLSSANGGDMDAILDPERELNPDFNVEMRADPDAHPSLRPGVTLWTQPGDDVVEDIIPLDDRDFFPGGPESETAVAYTRLIDAVAARPTVLDDSPVTMYRGMSDAEIDAWEAGEEIPAGKFFTSRPTTAYAQDIAGELPVLQAYRIPRSALIEVAPGEFQLRKRARQQGGHIRPITGAGIWDELKHPRHSAGSEKGGEFAPKGQGVISESVAEAPPRDDPLALPGPPRDDRMMKDLTPAERKAFQQQIEMAQQEEAFLRRMLALQEERAAEELAGTFKRHADENQPPSAFLIDSTQAELDVLDEDIEFEREDGDPNGLIPSMEEERQRIVEAQQGIHRALEAVDKVHELPASADQVELIFDGSLGNGTWGQHYAERYSPADASLPERMTSRRLSVNPTKDPGDAAGTMVHEFGHYVDVQIGDGTDWFSNSEAAAGWRAAVHDSKSIDVIRAYGPMDRVYTDYLMTNQELWARSYAQWVALRSGDSQLMGSVRFPGVRDGLEEKQWSDEDFGPIAVQIDKIMEQWRRP